MSNPLRSVMPECESVHDQLTTTQPVARGLPIEWAEELEPHLNSLWLIKNTLPEQGVALIYGHPGSGKSFLAVDIGMHVALGRAWNEQPTRQGIVVYVGSEGQKGLRNRIVAFRRNYAVDNQPIPLALIPSSIDLYGSLSDRHALAEAVRKAAKRYDSDPALIVVDTLSKTMGAGKENTDDLAVYIGNCEALATGFRCCVLVVHHRPKGEESRDPRGHSSLKGGVDTMILVEAGPLKRATITKQKEGEERQLLTFRLDSVELGVDNEGDPVSSCVVTPANPLGKDVRTITRRKIEQLKSPNHRIVFEQIGKLISSNGMIVPDEIPDEQINRLRVGKVVSLKLVADTCAAVLRTSTDNAPDTARTQFKRARERLQSLEMIGVWENWLWLTHE